MITFDEAFKEIGTGREVLYSPYIGAPEETGVIVGVRTNGAAMVRYGRDRNAKSTRLEDIRWKIAPLKSV